MRLFFAFDLPRDQRERLAALLPDPAPGVRRVPPDRLHVTLRWVGNVPETTRSALVDRFSRLAWPTGAARISGVGTFPNPGRPRVLWAGIEADAHVRDVRQGLEMLCRDAGVDPDPVPWRPHVTLGRMKGGRPEWLSGFVAEHEALAMEPFGVGSITLYDSIPGATGVRYEPVATCTAG